MALVGGVAMQAYGSDRLTKAIDFVASGPIDALPFREELSFGGARSQAENGVEVDLILRRDEYAALYAEALENARPVGDLPTRVVTAEYLVALKMAAARDKDELDLEWLLGRPGLDRKQARAIVARHLGEHAARELDALIAEVDWRGSRPK